MLNKFIFFILFSMFQYSFANNPIIIVRPEGNYKPNEFTINGKLVGLHIDTVAAVFKKLNWVYKFESYPWGRCLNLIHKGEADAITYIETNPERESYVYFDSNSVISEGYFSFWTLKENKEKFKFDGDINTFAKKISSLGLITNYNYEDAILKAPVFKEWNKNETIAAKKLQSKRLDVFYGQFQDFIGVLKELKLQNEIIEIQPPVMSVKNYIAFSKKITKSEEEKQLALKRSQEFAKAIAQFKKSDEYKAILKKYNIAIR